MALAAGGLRAQTLPTPAPKAASGVRSSYAPRTATAPTAAPDADSDQATTPPAPTSQAPTQPPLPRKMVRVPIARLNAERNGVLTVRGPERLRLETETGSVVIHTGAPGAIRYAVHIEADSREPDAQKMLDDFQVAGVARPGMALITGRSMEFRRRARLWVTYDVSVPRTTRVEVSTRLGNVRVDGVAREVSLDTDSGDVSVGRVSGPARLVTKGGHIVAGDIGGDLRAETLGGHITVANVGGDAVLTTGGGHIRAGRISGTAQLDTGGGNVYVESAGGRVTASSAGGQINFGEAAGAIQAHTAGGGIRVLRVAGPMQLESNGGSILLTQVDNQVHASTGTGSITAWFVPNAKLASASELLSGQGDIFVYVPRSVSLTIDATVDSPGDHRIDADGTIPLKVRYVTTAAGKQLRGECAINGGGEVLKLKTTSGNIHLRSADALLSRQQALIDQQFQQQMALFELQIKRMSDQDPDEVRQEMKMAMDKLQRAQDLARTTPLARTPMPPQPKVPSEWISTTPSAAAPALAPMPPEAATPVVAPGMTDVWWMKLSAVWYGGVPVDYEEQQRRIVRPVAQPAYPEVAREAGIEGLVELRVLIDESGKLTDIRAVSGEPVLLQAAIDAVRQWKYRPLVIEKKPVKVMTVIRLDFKLQ